MFGLTGAVVVIRLQLLLVVASNLKRALGNLGLWERLGEVRLHFVPGGVWFLTQNNADVRVASLWLLGNGVLDGECLIDSEFRLLQLLHNLGHQDCACDH